MHMPCRIGGLQSRSIVPCRYNKYLKFCNATFSEARYVKLNDSYKGCINKSCAAERLWKISGITPTRKINEVAMLKSHTSGIEPSSLFKYVRGHLPLLHSLTQIEYPIRGRSKEVYIATKDNRRCWLYVLWRHKHCLYVPIGYQKL